jgi:hypothetical protein
MLVYDSFDDWVAGHLTEVEPEKEEKDEQKKKE